MKKLLPILALLFASIFVSSAYAEDTYVGPMSAFMMSPMTARINLNPGDTYIGSFWIMNPEENTVLIKYSLSVRSFYRNDGGEAIFEDVEGRGQMAEWITLNIPDGNTLAPREFDEIKYTITVPKDAPAGGQYAAITATTVGVGDGLPSSISVNENIAMAHTIFAEVSGQTRKSAEITDLNSPGFLFDGNIVASSKVKNTGNVHGTATYTLEVFPLFSNQPVYSNAENPDKKLVLPDRTITRETTFENTPAAGIFNLVYKVEFENGETKELRKLIIKCPLWVFIIILTVITGIIVTIILKIRKNLDKTRQGGKLEVE